MCAANARPSDKDDLDSELEIMRHMEPHPNIINLLGQCSETGGHVWIVLSDRFKNFGLSLIIASFPDHMEELHMTWEWDCIEELVLCLVGVNNSTSSANVISRLVQFDVN